MNAQTSMDAFKASLTCTVGGRNAEYHAKIVAVDDLFQVSVQYGAIGSTLQSTTKPAKPVPLDKAIKEFEKVIKEKTAKGYVFDGVAPSDQVNSAASTREVSGLLPQLLNPIGPNESGTYLADGRFGAMEKMDGKRLTVQYNVRAPFGGQSVRGINKLGLVCSVPGEVADALSRQLPVDSCTIDGELIGQKLYVFDLLEFNGSDYRDRPYRERHELLGLLLMDAGRPASLPLVPLVIGQTAKEALYAELLARKAEGLVYKRLSAPHVSGRPNSGGDQLKDKFCESASCLVIDASGTKRSVKLGLYNVKGELVPVGKVTIPANAAVPKAGDVVEVRYLYLYSIGGSLVQPVYLGARDDVTPQECRFSQVTRIRAAQADADTEED